VEQVLRYLYMSLIAVIKESEIGLHINDVILVVNDVVYVSHPVLVYT